MRPAARIVDAGPPPDAGRSVETEEQPGRHARALLDPEVRVEHHGLRRGEQRAAAIEVRPARLHHPDPRVAEVPGEAHEEVRGGNEVGVEQRDPLAAGFQESGCQRAGLEAVPVAPPPHARLDAPLSKERHGTIDPLAGVVGRVVEHLDLEPLARVLECAGRGDQPLDHAPLVVDRQLDGEERQRCGEGGRGGRPAAAKRAHQLNGPVAREQQQGRLAENEQRHEDRQQPRVQGTRSGAIRPGTGLLAGGIMVRRI